MVPNGEETTVLLAVVRDTWGRRGEMKTVVGGEMMVLVRMVWGVWILCGGVNMVDAGEEMTVLVPAELKGEDTTVLLPTTLPLRGVRGV